MDPWSVTPPQWITKQYSSAIYDSNIGLVHLVSHKPSPIWRETGKSYGNPTNIQNFAEQVRAKLA